MNFVCKKWHKFTEPKFMLPLDSRPTGRHFLQIPRPTNVPDRVLRAIDNVTLDHRGPEFAVLGKAVLAGMKKVFKTQADVVICPASSIRHRRLGGGAGQYAT
jgi:hypothetical protein